MNSNALRELFLNYFAGQGHTVVPSASLVPAHDPSLLFTNAGMVPFKDVFLGLEKRAYSRAASSQRCMRAGGKHNDLENVGYTARHHTFFEMLGNFSFGDYFKREAIQYSWKFLTEVLKLPPEKLWITVFEEDDEAAAIWLNEIKTDPSRFSRCGSNDNFWSMGDTGPCGPCSEIFYDHGPSIAGGPPGSPTADGDRYVEIWNLVFMQFQRAADGALSPLPKLSVDTGMGLERLAAVMQGVTNNYDTDLFQPLIKAVAEEAGITDFANTSLRVIADHIRSCAFLISDGVLPGNEGRSYVLRRIMRRAIRHGHKIGLDKPFFYRLVKPLAEQMSQAYPELERKRRSIEKIIVQEEQQFARTLTHGMKLFEQEVAKLKGKKQLPGDVLFRLYDTYGFPVDLTADVARERGLTIDMPGFEFEMQRQRNQSKASSQFATTPTFSLSGNLPTEFTGYKKLSQTKVAIVELLKGNELVESLSEGDEGYIVLQKTPFYAESGGQVGDVGQLAAESAEFLVTNTIKKGDVVLHSGRLTKGSLKKGDKINATVDMAKRRAITLNHSATHLLHAALRQILGEHVVQKGSLVEAERLRFDFSHTKPISSETLKEVEDLVNQQIRANFPVQTEVMSPEDAKRGGAMAIFGEKYGDSVRVLTMGDFSKELCGGTHVSRTGDIGLFKIMAETGVAAGIRRLQAVTGQAALNWIASLEEQTRQLAKLFKASSDNLVEKAQNKIQSKQSLQKQIEELQRSVVGMMGDELVSQAIEIRGIQLLMSEINGVDTTGLRYLLDQLKNKLNRAVIILASTDQGRTQFLISVTKELTDQIKANELANELAKLIGGKGGGRADFAQAGGEMSEGLEMAFKSAKNWVEAHLNGNYA
ncbi:alanine--tRNA ligase [Candidatus Rickettsiella viridis]|uniref:Alanine--tRNA ligase n=1 Tax=Candidatus Rickettsiella viridis TaxID=676208 RepID=A0A2Z5UV70_9COXI|nr:alanine--tRNA ligase [Candidatus Rickettsiella viridis]BBB14850.1 alanine--tRNA ligase [Candidatus Rickettsiella viridis]